MEAPEIDNITKAIRDTGAIEAITYIEEPEYKALSAPRSPETGPESLDNNALDTIIVDTSNL
jgi:hypothetical protein